MVSDQKGRSGKKPKYQIADIGGTDLTSQDKSTEKVLNFLIRGGDTSNQMDSEASSLNSSEKSIVPPATAQTTANQAETDTSTTETRPKKRLDHLFERASGAKTAATAKDLKLQLPVEEQESIPSSTAQPETANKESIEETGDRQGDALSTQSIDTAQQTPAPSVETALLITSGSEQSALTQSPQIEDLSIESDIYETELARHVETWKNFYRLKDGEIEALKTMHRMSHAQGTSECYIKMHKLAEMSNLTYRYCQKVVRSLEHLGWITMLKEYDAANQLGVLYRVNLKPVNYLS